MNIVVIDDDKLVSISLKTIIESSQTVHVVAVGGSGEEAIKLYDEYKPDVMLMDIRMQGMSGLEAGETILEKHKNARILYLTTFSDDEYIIKALKIGAKGYILKQQFEAIVPALETVMRGQNARILYLTTFSDDEYIIKALKIGAKGYILKQQFEAIVPALETVMRGQIVFEEAVMTKIPSLLTQKDARFDYAKFDINEKEHEIIELVAEGLSNKEIAAELFLSEGTVRNYISIVLSKLELRDRTQLAVFYYKNLSNN